MSGTFPPHSECFLGVPGRQQGAPEKTLWGYTVPWRGELPQGGMSAQQCPHWEGQCPYGGFSIYRPSPPPGWPPLHLLHMTCPFPQSSGGKEGTGIRNLPQAPDPAVGGRAPCSLQEDRLLGCTIPGRPSIHTSMSEAPARRSRWNRQEGAFPAGAVGASLAGQGLSLATG